MKRFDDPILEVVRLNANDIIVTSGESCGGAACTSDTEEDEGL